MLVQVHVTYTNPIHETWERNSLFLNVHFAPGKFVLTQDEYIATEFMNNLAFVLWGAMFQHMLDDIVSVLVLYKSLSVLVQFIQYWTSLFWHAVLQDALDHTAPIRMRGQCIHLKIKQSVNFKEQTQLLD